MDCDIPSEPPTATLADNSQRRRHWLTPTFFPVCAWWQWFTVLAAITLAGCDFAPSPTTPPFSKPNLPAEVRDARSRFVELFCAIRNHHGYRLPDDRPCEKALWDFADAASPTNRPPQLDKATRRLRVIVVPGIFGECVTHWITPFSYALAHLRQHGYRTGLIQVSGRSSSTYNAKQIRDALFAYPRHEKWILIGYSKGIADILEALVAYPELHHQTAAVVSIAGAVKGTPLADQVPDRLLRWLYKIMVPTCPPGDHGGIVSLRRSVRRAWLSQHSLPASVAYFSLPSFAHRSEISLILRPSYWQLSQIDPRNDSQVIFSDAIIPGSTLLGFAKADHWAVALPFSREFPLLAATLINHNAFPREVLLEATVRFIEEDLPLR